MGHTISVSHCLYQLHPQKCISGQGKPISNNFSAHMVLSRHQRKCKREACVLWLFFFLFVSPGTGMLFMVGAVGSRHEGAGQVHSLPPPLAMSGSELKASKIKTSACAHI